MGLLDSLEKSAGGIASDIGKSIKKDPVMGAFVGGASAVPNAFSKVFNPHIPRGHDIRDREKTARDVIRNAVDLSDNIDFRRPNQLYSLYQRAQPQLIAKPVISMRGGNLKDMVKQGREKAQFNKSMSNFTQTAIPNKMKIGGGFIM
jgi:hypothetical protein